MDFSLNELKNGNWDEIIDKKKTISKREEEIKALEKENYALKEKIEEVAKLY